MTICKNCECWKSKLKNVMAENKQLFQDRARIIDEMQEVRRASREADTAAKVYVERCALLEREIERTKNRQDDGADSKYNLRRMR